MKTPYDLETEKAVLGSVLLSEGPALDEILPILGGGEAFHEPAHRMIFEAMVAAHRGGKGLDGLRVAEHLGGDLEACGGHYYLGELAGAVPTSANAGIYAARVRDLAAMRDLSRTCKHISAKAEEADDPGALLEEAEREIFRLTQARGQGAEPKRLADALPDTMNYFRQMAEPNRRDGLDGLPSGIPGLDSLLGGLRGGEMIVVAARPGCGKTAALLNMAAHLAESGTPCLFFSLEMDRGQIARRVVAMRGNSDPHRLHWQSGGGLERAEHAAKVVSEWPLWIDDAPRRSVWDIRGIARRWKSRNGHGVIFLDYLQLCQLEKRSQKLAQRYQEIGEISHSLKALSRELACPVVVACQLSREADKVANGFQMLSCLRESGDIEADADAVIILSGLSEKDQKALGIREAENVIRMTLAKHRHGETGTRNIFFDKPVQKFRALTGEPEPAPARRTAPTMGTYDVIFEEPEIEHEESETCPF